MNDGQWHHVAFSRPDGGQVKVFIDGQHEATGNSNQIDILSNGFNIRGAQVGTAGSGKDYVYCAWADQPFKTARAR